MEKKKEYGLFEAPRWREIPAVEVIGHREITEEEKKEVEEFKKQLKKKKTMSHTGDGSVYELK